jgi:SOS-response transcriptional repressor LexA
LTERQAAIASFITRVYGETGTGVGYREICREFGFEKEGKPYPNAAKGHVDALIKKGAIVASFEENEDGTKTVKANSLRPANAIFGKSADSRIGENYCLNIVGDFVAFMFFADGKILKSDLIPVADAIRFADRFKIPSGEMIGRLELLASKMATKEVAKTTV